MHERASSAGAFVGGAVRDGGVRVVSGYAANATTLAATCGSRECAIFSDALNHASIVDGCRMAKASASVFVFHTAITTRWSSVAS